MDEGGYGEIKSCYIENKLTYACWTCNIELNSAN